MNHSIVLCYLLIKKVHKILKIILQKKVGKTLIFLREIYVNYDLKKLLD